MFNFQFDLYDPLCIELYDSLHEKPTVTSKKEEKKEALGRVRARRPGEHELGYIRSDSLEFSSESRFLYRKLRLNNDERTTATTNV